MTKRINVPPMSEKPVSQSGLITRIWHRFFLDLQKAANASSDADIEGLLTDVGGGDGADSDINVFEGASEKPGLTDIEMIQLFDGPEKPGLTDIEMIQLFDGPAGADVTVNGAGLNTSIVSMTGLTQITRATGGALDIAIGGAAGDDFTVDTSKLVVKGDTGSVGIGTTTPAAKLAINGGVHVGGDSDPGDNNLLVDGTGNFTGALTAASYADNTPGYDGDAVAELKKVKTVGGQIDHGSLPLVAQTDTGGRDLGAMISVLTVAVQELARRLEKLERIL